MCEIKIFPNENFSLMIFEIKQKKIVSSLGYCFGRGWLELGRSGQNLEFQLDSNQFIKKKVLLAMHYQRTWSMPDAPGQVAASSRGNNHGCCPHHSSASVSGTTTFQHEVDANLQCLALLFFERNVNDEIGIGEK